MSTASAKLLVAKGVSLLNARSCGNRLCAETHPSQPVQGNWSGVLKSYGADLDVSNPEDCPLGVLFGRYSTGLDRLGGIDGEDYGFASSSGASNRELTVEWLRVVGYAAEKEAVHEDGTVLKGKYASSTRLKLHSSSVVDEVRYYLVSWGKEVNGEFVKTSGVESCDEREIKENWLKIEPFTPAQGTFVGSKAAGKVWYVGVDNRLWVLKAGAPTAWDDLTTVKNAHPDLAQIVTYLGAVLGDTVN